jgi:hypothetical protein
VSVAGSTGRTPVPRSIRIADRIVRFPGDAALVARALGPLRALDEPSVSRPADLEAEVALAATSTALPPAGTPPEDAVVFEERDGAVRVRAPGVGVATLRADGGLRLEVDPEAPDGDAVAERLTIPALAESLRRAGVYLVHAAILRVPSPGLGVVVIPAARGGGKTTLALSLRRAHWSMLSDDRGWLTGAPGQPEIDPWPEPPRVGDRSLFLLPPHARPGLRDERTGKAPVPGLAPPRLDRTCPVVAVLLPRLVGGPGGRVAPAQGAAALAAVVSQMVVATARDTTGGSFRFAAAMMAHMPAFTVEVGDDPATLARAVEAVLAPGRATGSASGDRA